MSEYLTQILIALIGAVPPTIMAFAAWLRARRLEKPIEQVNNAVNHRAGGQRRLIEVIDSMADSMESISGTVRRVEGDLQQHRAWHQKEQEDDTGQQEDN
jgi:hypothetical protein